ncbi:MAG: hypothetical protein JST31_00030 [Actinobacteria bacterium]|nr:hypothetical protein [Actinomycetota bacterium]
MHWFDRFSKHVATAADARSSRRTVVKGAALATAVLPFAPGATTYAANRVRQKLAADTCLLCFSEATKSNQRGTFLNYCLGHQSGRSLLAPKGKKGKKPPKQSPAMKPAAAARDTSCQAQARQQFIYELELCRTKICSNPAPPPEVQPSPTIPGAGETACAAGTTKCTDTLCCYGGDACCVCANVEGGAICCAGVIGCTCC